MAVRSEKEREITALKGLLTQAEGGNVNPRIQADIDWYENRYIKIAKENLVSGEIPKTVYCQLSGRQPKVTNEQAARYSLPISGEVVSLKAVLTRFHDLIAEWAPLVKQATGEEPKTRKQQLELQVLERKVEAMEMEIHKKRGDFIEREDVRKSMIWLGQQIRAIGERLGKRFGSDAQVMLNEALERIEEELR